MEETIIDEEGTHRIRGTNDSDHNTILTTLNINIIHKPEKRTTWKKGTPEQWTHFNNIIKETENKKDLTNYNELEKTIGEALKEAIGTQTISNTKKKNKESATTKHLREIRNKLKKQYKQTTMNNENNKHEILQQYIQSQKALKEQIEKDLKEATQKIANKLIKEGGTILENQETNI